MVPNHVLYQVEPLLENGALEGIRTPDLLVRSQTLYPTELRAHVIITNYHILKLTITKLVAPAGIEPATQGFSVPCSTD